MHHGSHTVIVKIGSSLLVDEDSGHIKTDFLYRVINEISLLRSSGTNVVIVSSGSVALGRRYSNVSNSKKLTLAEKQAAAALGQPELMSAYQYLANEHNFRMPQILITLQDFENRKRFLNAEDTLNELLKQKAVPVVNENDTVATQHLRIGDNDRLAAKVAHLVEADALIILTDVDGLWDENKKIIKTVDQLDESIFNLAGDATGSGSGGMLTKLQAAEIAIAAGCITHITSGHGETPITNALDPNHLHTTILSDTSPEDARKLWIATSLDIQGEISIKPDSIAKVLQDEAVFPADIAEVKSEFKRGDTVSITCNGEEFARGLTAFYQYEVTALVENQSLSIFDTLGYDTDDGVVNQGDFVLIEQEPKEQNKKVDSNG